VAPGTNPSATCEKRDLPALAFQQVAEHVRADRTTALDRECRRIEMLAAKAGHHAPPKVSYSRWMQD
jgi:hypothetical protein